MCQLRTMEMEFHRSYTTSSSSSSSHHHHHQPKLASLSSQRSLASVPSLNSHSHRHASATYHHCLATLKGHTSYISCLTLAGKFLYTGSSDREIRSWNHAPFRSDLIHPDQLCSISNSTVTAGKGAVKSLIVQSDKLFSAHQDYKIRVWKISNDEHEPEQQKYTRVATLPTLGDRACKVLNPKNHVQIRRHKKCTWVHHVDTVSALAVSRDQTVLYSVSWDRSIKIWRTTDFTCLESVNNAHEDAINAIAVSGDGYVYTGSADKKIKVWKKVGEKKKKHCLVDTLEKHNSGINALGLSSDGSVLYSGACDRSILVWEKSESEEGEGKMVVVGALRGHTKSILCLAVVSDLVCSGSADKSIRVWRGVHGEYSCLAVLEGHMGPVKCLAAVEDRCDSSEASFLVYSGALDCHIKVWHIIVPLL